MSEPCRTTEVCNKHQSLEDSLGRIERTVTEGIGGINKTLKEVASDLRNGAVEMSAMKIRILLLDKCVA